MKKVRIVDGWLVVDTDAVDTAVVEIGVTAFGETTFTPAFRDYDNGKRVAKIKLGPESMRALITLKVDGRETSLGSIVVQ